MKRCNRAIRAALCVLLCGVLCFSSVVSAAALVTPLYGDANDDGVINMKDALLLRRHLVGLETEIHSVLADADASGGINMKDVLLVRRYVAGFDVTFGEGAHPLQLPLSEGRDVRFSLYDVKTDGNGGFELSVAAENLTADRTMELTLFGASLNDVATLPLWSVTMKPGQGKVENLSLNLSEIAPIEGETLEKIGLYFLALDSETGEPLDVGNQPIFYYPTGANGTYVPRDRAPAAGVTLLSNSEINIVATDVTIEKELAVWQLYVENRTDKPMLYVCDGATVNGKTVGAIWMGMLLPHTSMYTGMIFSALEWEEKGISAIDTAAFSLDAYDMDALFAEEPTPLHSYNVAYTAG